MKSSRGFLLSLAALLGACGGGGSDGDALTSVSVPVASAVALNVDQSMSAAVTISGVATADGQVAFTGTGTYVESTIASTFEGQPALEKSTALTGVLAMGDTTVPVSVTGQTYFDANRRPLGARGPQTYCVTTSVSPIPDSAVVGTSGPWYTMECFSSASKVLRVGTVSASYVVETDTPGSALVKVGRQMAPIGAATLPVSTTYRVTTSGVITRLEDNIAVASNGVTLAMKVTYR